MKTLSILLGVAAVVFLPMRSAGLEMGFNQDITNNTGQDAFDFHLEGTLKSADPPVQLRDFCFDQPPGSIPGFDWRYDGGTITHVGGNVYHYSGGWSGTVPVPPGQMIHIGKYFDETCRNICVDLRGWWTDREGEKINPEAGTREGEIWLSDVPLIGFEILDNIPARLTDPNLPQTVMLQNATNHAIQVESALVAVTDLDIPLEQLVPDSELLNSIDNWRDFPSSPSLAPGESWTFDLSEVDLEIGPNQNTVVRVEFLDEGTGEFHFYAGKCRAHGRPPEPVRIVTLEDWETLLRRPAGEYPRIAAVDGNDFSEMVTLSDAWPPEYREAIFVTPDLDARDHADGSGAVEAGLYMRWGPAGEVVQPGQYYGAAWDYDYGAPSDLSNAVLEFSIHAPWESMNVSINLIDVDNDWREFIWHVGGPGEIPACEWTIVRLAPSAGDSNYRLRLPGFEGGPSDGRVDLSRIDRIRFDENGVWSEELAIPLDDGWEWNAWNHIAVEPRPLRLVGAFAFGSRLLDCPTFNDPSVSYTMVHHGSPEDLSYDPDRGWGYEVVYPAGSPFGDRSGYGVFGPFDDSPNNRNKFPDACPEELYDSFIGCKDFSAECSAVTIGNPCSPCSPTLLPEGIIFRVDVPNGLYRFVGAFGDADNVHAHRILAEDGGWGPPDMIGTNHVVLVNNFDQAQFALGEADEAEPGEGVFARVGFDGLIPPPGDGVAPSPQFVDMDQGGFAFYGPADSPVLEVTQGYIRIHQLQGNSNDGVGGPRDANGGDIVILELWQVGALP